MPWSWACLSPTRNWRESPAWGVCSNFGGSAGVKQLGGVGRRREVGTDTEAVDQATFDAFYREHYAPMVRLARLLTGSVAVAEDLDARRLRAGGAPARFARATGRLPAHHRRQRLPVAPPSRGGGRSADTDADDRDGTGAAQLVEFEDALGPAARAAAGRHRAALLRRPRRRRHRRAARVPATHRPHARPPRHGRTERGDRTMSPIDTEHEDRVRTLLRDLADTTPIRPRESFRQANARRRACVLAARTRGRSPGGAGGRRVERPSRRAWVLAAAAIVAVFVLVGALLVNRDSADRFAVDAGDVPVVDTAALADGRLAFVMENDLFLADGAERRGAPHHRHGHRRGGVARELVARRRVGGVQHPRRERPVGGEARRLGASPPRPLAARRTPGRRRPTSWSTRPPTRCASPRSTARRVHWKAGRRLGPVHHGGVVARPAIRCRSPGPTASWPSPRCATAPTPAGGPATRRRSARCSPGRPTTWCWSTELDPARAGARPRVPPLERRRPGTGRLPRSLRSADRSGRERRWADVRARPAEPMARAACGVYFGRHGQASCVASSPTLWPPSRSLAPGGRGDRRTSGDRW